MGSRTHWLRAAASTPDLLVCPVTLLAIIELGKIRLNSLRGGRLGQRSLRPKVRKLPGKLQALPRLEIPNHFAVLTTVDPTPERPDDLHLLDTGIRQDLDRDRSIVLRL